MGAAESVIRNTDKRSSRREHRPLFQQAIQAFRDKNGLKTLNLGSDEELESPSKSICVFVRKRPLFDYETEAGEFDVITTGFKEVVIHDARMHSDMLHLIMHHRRFEFDQVFDEFCNEEMIYNTVGSPMVNCAVMGGFATILMFGQTGSGKTYTMNSIYERATSEIFELLNDDQIKVHISFFEISGNMCSDMLNEGKELKLMTRSDGMTVPLHAVKAKCDKSEHLKELINHASALRATEATGVNNTSSRSHAICKIFIKKDAENKNEKFEGVLTLVDLAGTETRIDSDKHDAARRRESSQINTSLMNLKDCIRIMSQEQRTMSPEKKSFVPFRRSSLTSILKPSFTSQNAMTAIITTVSPSSKDTEHSMCTLRNACLMDGSELVSNVETENLGSIDVTKLARDKRNTKKSENLHDNDSPEARLDAFDREKSSTISHAQVVEIRHKRLQKLEHKAFKKLSDEIKEELLSARKLSQKSSNDADQLTQKLGNERKLSRKERIAERAKKDINRNEIINDKAEEKTVSSSSIKSDGQSDQASEMVTPMKKSVKTKNSNLPTAEKTNVSAKTCSTSKIHNTKNNGISDKASRSNASKSIEELEEILEKGNLSCIDAEGIKKQIKFRKARVLREEAKKQRAQESDSNQSNRNSSNSGFKSTPKPLQFDEKSTIHETQFGRAKKHVVNAEIAKENEKLKPENTKSDLVLDEAVNLFNNMSLTENLNSKKNGNHTNKNPSTGASAAPFATDYNWKQNEGINAKKIWKM